ncbi:MAG: cytochrome c, partial [Elusimicrobia bacterium]|nr:cytochrome c [Elusimicrobiota bacterium]
MKNKALIPAVLFAAALAVLLVGTRQDLNEPHLRLINDMVYSSAYQSEDPNPVFKDGRTLQVPPAHTISRGSQPFLYGPSEEDRERAGRELKNPFQPDLANLQQGQYVFENFCSHCHGPAAEGDGQVAKLFPQFSRKLDGPSVAGLPDGTLFHIITYGMGLMPPARYQLSQDDRWKVILYLRDLQERKAHAPVKLDPRR